MSLKAVIKSGQQTVATAGTQVALSATDVWVRKLQLRAPSSNAGAIAIGDSTVDMTSGLLLAAGATETLAVLDPRDASKSLPFNLKDIYVDAANNGDKVAFLYYDT